jgi:hypothetical protein
MPLRELVESLYDGEGVGLQDRRRDPDGPIVDRQYMIGTLTT